MNQRGHSDWTGMAWLLGIVAVVCFLLEGSFVALTIAFWELTKVRILFGTLALLGGALITWAVVKLWK